METNTDAQIELLHTTARTLLKAGHTKELIEAKLVSIGATPNYAKMIIENVGSD